MTVHGSWLFCAVDDDVPVASSGTTTKLHANERCKFWPACKNGDTCQFHHPTQPCKSVCSAVLILHRVQKKSNIFIFTIYFSQFLDKFCETFSVYP